MTSTHHGAQRSKHPNALPLLITHGWPGSVVEFEKIVAPLTDPTSYGGRVEDAFHVIAPSLPASGSRIIRRNRAGGRRRWRGFLLS